MRFGASIWGFFYQRGPESWPTLAEAVDEIASLDKTLGVEVWGSRALDQPMVEGQELADLVDACQDAAFVTVHIQGQHWSWNPVTLRREVDFAHLLGAETLVLHPVCLGLQVPEDRPDWPEIVRIADYAAKFGVRLAVENIFDSVWCLDRILEELGDDPEDTNLGICIDVGHAAVSKDAGRESVCNYLDRYASQLLHLHLHDNSGMRDDHLIPGQGTIDWPRVMAKIRELPFTGTAVLEVHDPSATPKESLKRGLSFVKQAGF
ncbi:sugar phosphate isomerase/epimerase [Candidatus Bipolaricaulota bacterium]|nr:sugar phosphate isomerase/epimerase [Candidatus Bipolaricaulota bacterium]TFH10211.1 MAG: sugar phosphate isomerase/epimerase [Candidatus Atribacteria bacterium]